MCERGYNSFTGEQLWRFTRMATTCNKALMRLSTRLQVRGNQHHILAYIVVKDVGMKLRQTRVIQCHRRTTISIPQFKEIFVGG